VGNAEKTKRMNLTTDKITSIKNNLFYRSLEIIPDFYTFPWHQYKGEIDTDKVNASQAIAIDFWGCLYSSKYKDELINTLFNTKSKVWSIELEYTNSELLNEPTSTQIDVLLKSSDKAIFIESKFTEKGGNCSQPPKKCNGNYQLQINPENEKKSKCSLTGKNIRYWEFIEKVTDYKMDSEYFSCPFKGMEYQWMRNICFAKAYSEKHSGITTETYLFYYNSPKNHISQLVNKGNQLGSLTGNLKTKFDTKSYNNCISLCIDYLKTIDLNEMNVWIELNKWMSDKDKKLK